MYGVLHTWSYFWCFSPCHLSLEIMICFHMCSCRSNFAAVHLRFGLASKIHYQLQWLVVEHFQSFQCTVGRARPVAGGNTRSMWGMGIRFTAWPESWHRASPQANLILPAIFPPAYPTCTMQVNHGAHLSGRTTSAPQHQIKPLLRKHPYRYYHDWTFLLFENTLPHALNSGRRHVWNRYHPSGEKQPTS